MALQKWEQCYLKLSIGVPAHPEAGWLVTPEFGTRSLIWPESRYYLLGKPIGFRHLAGAQATLSFFQLMHIVEGEYEIYERSNYNTIDDFVKSVSVRLR